MFIGHTLNYVCYSSSPAHHTHTLCRFAATVSVHGFHYHIASPCLALGVLSACVLVVDTPAHTGNSFRQLPQFYVGLVGHDFTANHDAPFNPVLGGHRSVPVVLRRSATRHRCLCGNSNLSNESGGDFPVAQLAYKCSRALAFDVINRNNQVAGPV